MKNSKSRTAESQIESKLGCRYSVLLKLPYFDPVRMTLIDPMHNLFLGSAKHFTKDILIGMGNLSKAELDVVHKRISITQVPLYMGRLPSRIDSGSTFTAQQWMNWTLYFSVFCLHGLLTTEQIECWRAFVLACRRLCKHSISVEDIKVADLLLIQFCKRVKRLFGTKFVTPNMHMHFHLSECLQDYGPLHSFWLYSFERYNGLLGNQPTNNRSIELQLLQRFLRDNSHLDLLSRAENMPLATEFRDVVCGHALQFQSTSESVIVENDHTFPLPGKYTLTALDSNEVHFIREVYAYLYPDMSAHFLNEENACPSTCKKYTHILLSGKKLSSTCEAMGGKVPYALAMPIESSPTSTDPQARPAKIHYFIQHSWLLNISVEAEPHHYSHILAVCTWPQQHPCRDIMGKPVQVWCKGLGDGGINPFIRIQNITSRVIVAIDSVNEESVLIVIPLVQ